MTSPIRENLRRNPGAPLTGSIIVVLVALSIASGCAARAAAPGAATTPAVATPTAAAPEPTPVPAAGLTRQELIGLERKVGTTPPLAQGVEPAPAPVAGLPGTPGASPAYGPEDAPVRIYVFTDFECPVCPRVVEPLKHLVRAYPDEVRVIVKQNALANHPGAARLAAASLAAFRQGKFWEFHDRLFAGPRRVSDADLNAHAEALGLDVPRFQRDMEDEAIVEQVKYESALAASIDFGATPAFVVNGRADKGWGSYMSLESRVKRELERANEIAEEGVPVERVAYEATRRYGPAGEKLAVALFVIPK